MLNVVFIGTGFWKMGDLKGELSKEAIFGLNVWELIAIFVGLFLVIIIAIVPLCLMVCKKGRRAKGNIPVSQIPSVSKEIKEIRVEHISTNAYVPSEGKYMTLKETFSDRDFDKVVVHGDSGKMRNGDASSQSGSFHHLDGGGSVSGDEVGSGTYAMYKPSSSHPITAPSPLSGLPEFSHLGWGHWFTLRDLEVATNRFSTENVIGEGGYGIVYKGSLVNGTPVAIKRILNNL